jgi:4'-phosphopantetheinyl transferase
MTAIHHGTILWPSPPTNALRFQVIPNDNLLSPVQDVHVWAAVLEASPETLNRFAATLSSTESERAARFRFERDRRRFIVGRGMMRAILGGYLSADSRAIEFACGPRGKPTLAGPFAEGGLHFNLAHSEELALLAVTRAGPVGVDVERIRETAEAQELAARFFSARETAALQGLAAEQKAAAFFNLWTRKEAWLKATGEGIAHSLHRVEVSFLPEEPARLVNLPADLAGNTRWTLHDLAPAPCFAAALAVAAKQVRIHCWAWSHQRTGGE